MEERNLIVFHKTHTCSSFCKEAAPMWYLWLVVFKLLFKTHEKQTWKRETSLFFLKHTLAVHFVRKLFQCDICDFLFSISYLKHMKNKHGGETSYFFSKHTLAVHFVKKLFQCDICDYCCFQVVIKTHEKQIWRRENS